MPCEVPKTTVRKLPNITLICNGKSVSVKKARMQDKVHLVVIEKTRARLEARSLLALLLIRILDSIQSVEDRQQDVIKVGRTHRQTQRTSHLS